jgi:hypothetical protein
LKTFDSFLKHRLFIGYSSLAAELNGYPGPRHVLELGDLEPFRDAACDGATCSPRTYSSRHVSVCIRCANFSSGCFSVSAN